MLRQVRAKAPLLYKLAYRSKQASDYAHSCTTAFQKKAFVIELDGVNSQLVAESIKLGQSVMSALGKNKDIATLENFSKEIREEIPREAEGENSDGRESLAMPMRSALLTGAGLAAVPAMAANYTLGKASDDFDSKLWAIPGVAAATVGAILAARAGNSSDPSKEIEVPAKELENAINAREVLVTAMDDTSESDTYEELAKMSSISTDHIASLITDLLI
jgi:hypothetical protein